MREIKGLKKRRAGRIKKRGIKQGFVGRAGVKMELRNSYYPVKVTADQRVKQVITLMQLTENL